MPISWNEIRTRSIAFSKEWANAIDENSDAKSFWDDLFRVFDVSRRRVATFESRVKKGDGSQGFIDLLWKKVVLVEHKTRGKDLSRAHTQAKDYFPGLKDSELPRYIVVSDFARFKIFDLETDEEQEFTLEQLPDRIQALGFIAGYQTRTFREQDPVNKTAALQIALLHDELKAIGYEGHELEVLLVRLLFCLFADDTGIFMPRDIFQDYLIDRTAEDGSDLGGHLQELFQTLNRPTSKRYKSLDEHLTQFPYVNGELFKENLQIAAFTSKLRQLLIDCCDVDWGEISPAIFGSLFQSIMDEEERSVLGAHYTSEKNILKAIGPLFLEDLRTEFDALKTQRSKLLAFHEKLATLHFFDPACGCGNFLVIAYRELRLLELDVIRILYGKEIQQLALDAIYQYVKIDVDQFHGIEIEEWPAQIARVAMWLIDHQMNVRVSKEFGNSLVRVPLVKSADIHIGDALLMDWNDVHPAAECNFVLGNPPFRGARVMSKEQKAAATVALSGVLGLNDLDFVAGWYVKTASYLNPSAKAALVSTNSITQGKQVGILWRHLLAMGVHINFAHRTFKWKNEAGNVAGVHCVIIGFAKFVPKRKRLFDYATASGEPLEIAASNISPYLVDADNVLLEERSKPISSNVSPMSYGSMPNDDGELLMYEAEKAEMLRLDPAAGQFIREFFQVDEFLYDQKRYALWLVDAPSQEIKKIASIRERLVRCRAYRSKSTRIATKKLADTPGLFGENRQPSGEYLLVPAHTGESRKYIPMGFMSADKICGNANLMVPNASLYEFGILSSHMHMAWVASVCGRLESRYRYSARIVYNNFPWPDDISEAKRTAIELAAQEVLDRRAEQKGASLADLYDPLLTPVALLTAHQRLDKAVDTAYGRKSFSSDAERVSFLLGKYEALIAAAELAKPPKKVRKKKVIPQMS